MSETESKIRRRERRWLAPSGVTFAALALAASVVVAAAGELPGDLRLPGWRGGELTSRDLASGDHVLIVWAGWSPRCRDIVERVNGIDARWGNAARVATINFQEDGSAIEEFLRGKSLHAPVYLDRDGEFSKSLEITALPGLVVIRGGKVRFRGRLPADPDPTLGDLLR